jgi:hypothetical protein
VIPSSTQFLLLYRTESVSLHRFNWRLFQQNRSQTDVAALILDVSFAP